MTDMFHKTHFKRAHTNCELSEPRIPVFRLHLKTWPICTAKAARQGASVRREERERTENSLGFSDSCLYFSSLSQQSSSEDSLLGELHCNYLIKGTYLVSLL